MEKQEPKLRTSFGRDGVIQNSYKVDLDNDGNKYVIVKMKPSNLLLTTEQFILIRNFFPRGKLFCDTDGIYKVNFSRRYTPERDIPLENIFTGELLPKSTTNDFRSFGVDYVNGFCTWDLYRDGTSLALISSCILDDKNQTMNQLAYRIASMKQISPEQVLKKLEFLRDINMLGYYRYDIGRYIWTRWEPRKE